MSRWVGRIISAVVPTASGGKYGNAFGIWNMHEEAGFVGSNVWPQAAAVGDSTKGMFMLGCSSEFPGANKLHKYTYSNDSEAVSSNRLLYTWGTAHQMVLPVSIDNK